MPAQDTLYLHDAILFLLAAVVIVPLFRQMRASPVIGYLVAGAVIGPHGFAFVREVEGTYSLAELGVVFLLFTIGLELSVERLKVMARYVFGLGSAQVAATTLLLGPAAALLGAGIGQAAVIGGALALSSTAFVLQLLSERGELPSRLGRVVLAVLLMQDLAVVPGLAIVLALGDPSESVAASLALAGGKALLAVAVLLAAGRWVLRPLYRVIAAARNSELFVATTLLVALGTAWGTAQAGLSMSLGAFLAGLMLAGTEYRHQIEADIEPFRGLLLGLFFISTGMLIDLRLIADQLALVLALAVGIVLAKAAIVAVLARLFGFRLPLAINIALHLAQGGEFAFVLLSMAMRSAVIPVAEAQLLLGAVAISMAATPLLAEAGRRAQRRLEQRRLDDLAGLAEEAAELSDHVIIAGFGRVGQTVAHMLESQQRPYLALDIDPAHVEEGRRRGRPVFFGDAGRPLVLQAAGAERARAVVITMDDAAAARHAVGALRRRLPDLPILVRARDRAHLEQLADIGATAVVPEMAEASLQLGSAVLRALGLRDEQVDRVVEQFRADDYARLAGILEPQADRSGGLEGRRA